MVEASNYKVSLRIKGVSCHWFTQAATASACELAHATFPNFHPEMAPASVLHSPESLDTDSTRLSHVQCFEVTLASMRRSRRLSPAIQVQMSYGQLTVARYGRYDVVDEGH